MNHKVSVIMAVYNCQETIRESIDSIIAQTYENWEMIICDDGSSDKTRMIVEEYASRFPQIIAIHNEKNLKLPRSLNHCLQFVTGDYVARMDGDDKSDPERFAKQVAFLNRHPDIDVVGTGMTCFNEKGITGNRYPVEQPSPAVIGRGVPFFHATIMMKKEVYDRLGGYSLKPYVLRCEDVDLWIRFFGNGFRGDNLQEPLYYVREDLEAARRRNIKNGLNTSKTLYKGFLEYHYPLKQYVYILKPIISTIVPYKIKFFINQFRWRRKTE